MVNFNPYEQRKLTSLRPALKQGMDPMMAYDIFSGVESGALERMAQNRAMRAQMFADASDELRNAATSGMPQGGAMDLVESYQAETPGLARGKYQGRLEDLAGGLYEGPGKFSSAYMPEPGQASPGSLSQEDIQGLTEQAMAAAQVDPETGASQDSLHGARMALMTSLRNQGIYNEAALNQAYNIIGESYTAAGGDPGEAPVSFAERMAQERLNRRLGDISGSVQAPVDDNEWYSGLTEGLRGLITMA